MTYYSLIPQVMRAFGVLHFTCDTTPQKGYRNESYKITLESGENINLIFHKHEQEALQRIRSADEASFLLKDTFPVRIRYDKRILKLSDGQREVYAGLYTYLPGETIPWEAYTKNHIKLLGWAMSDMHHQWSFTDDAIDSYIIDELRALLDSMEQYFQKPGVVGALNDKLGVSLCTNLQASRSLFLQFDKEIEPQECLLHMDLVRGNVLFSPNGDTPWQIGDVALTGVIDFEKAAMGHPVFDIARTLAFLLVDCQAKNRSSIYKYFLQSGYNKRGKSSFIQKDVIVGIPASRVLNMLVGFFLIHDFYKFLKHTPYESLEDNHHFIRTRDILIDYGMIRLNKD